MKETIILDVDGVLRDMVTKTIETYKEYKNPLCKAKYNDVTTYDFKSAIPELDIWGFLSAPLFAREVFLHAKPYEENISDIVKQLHEKYNIHICTYQFRGNERYTLSWLKNNKIDYDSITFSEDKSCIKGQYLVDDYPKNFNNLSKETKGYLFNQPYNQGCSLDRINTIEELLIKLK